MYGWGPYGGSGYGSEDSSPSTVVGGYGSALWGGIPLGGDQPIPSGGIPSAYSASSADSLSVIDSASPTGYQGHLPTSDALSIADQAQAYRSTHTATTESFAISDFASGGSQTPVESVYKRIPGIGARATPRTGNPVNAPRYFRKSISVPPNHLIYSAFDTWSISDTAYLSTVTHLTASDNVALSDVSKEAVHYPRSAADSISIADSNTFAQGVSEFSSDSISIADVINQTGISTHIRVTDSVPISDKSRTSSTLGRTSDSLGFADNGTGTTGTNFNSASDSVPFGDSTTGTPGTNFNSSADSFLLPDKASLGVQGNESISISDTAIIRLPTGFETVSFTDNGTAVAGAIRAFLWQAAFETALQTNGAAELYQFGAEVGSAFSGNAGLYQYANEVAAAFTSSGAIYQYALEVADTNPSAMCLYQGAFEVAITPIWGNRIAPGAILGPKGPPFKGSPISRTAIPAPTTVGTPTLVSG